MDEQSLWVATDPSGYMYFYPREPYWSKLHSEWYLDGVAPLFIYGDFLTIISGMIEKKLNRKMNCRDKPIQLKIAL